MSELDEIVYETSRIVADNKLRDRSEIRQLAKQLFKDLMLKIADTAYSEKHEDSPHATEMWHEICNEIKQL